MSVRRSRKNRNKAGRHVTLPRKSHRALGLEHLYSTVRKTQNKTVILYLNLGNVLLQVTALGTALVEVWKWVGREFWDMAETTE